MRIASTHLWVHDQEVALKFWTDQVGMEVREDVSFPEEMGDFRWLTVGPPGQDDVSIVLMAVPGEPVMDDDTRKQVLDLTAKGFAGTVFLTTDDAHASYKTLTERGVEFTEPPTQMPYGIDSGFRDPSGNSVRLTQRTDYVHLERWGDGFLVEHEGFEGFDFGEVEVLLGSPAERGVGAGLMVGAALGDDVGGALLGAGAPAPRHHHRAVPAPVLRWTLLRLHRGGRRAQVRQDTSAARGGQDSLPCR